jgi:subtilisin family serine protease
MRRFTKILIVLWVLFMFSGPPFWEAHGEELGFSKRIVVFHQEVPRQEVMQYAREWEHLGVSVLMEIPFINGLILNVPVDISSAALAADPRVVSVESNQQVGIQAVNATADGGAADGGAADGGAADGGAADGGAADGGAADGGAADGGAADGGAADGGAQDSMPSWSFIEPASKPPRGHRPWGVLKLYEQLRHPGQATDQFYSFATPLVIRLALKNMKRKKIRVAILDTGVDSTHPSLARNVKGGFDVFTMTAGLPRDDNGHGTHIAGTLCSLLDGYPFGCLGHFTIPVEIYSVKILDQYASGDLFNIILGLQWVINNDIDVVNMSIGYREDSRAMRLAVQKAYEAGVIMVAAVGNHSTWDAPTPRAAADGGAADGGAADGGAADGGAADGGAADGGAADGGAADGGAADGGAADGTQDGLPWYSVMYPARYPEVIGVGASSPYGEIAEFSNSGQELDITAPGTDIVSTNVWKWGGFGVCSGTSMASPHVAGTVAMMLAIDPELSATEIRSILQESARELKYSPGIGDLNLTGALKKVYLRALRKAWRRRWLRYRGWR